MPAVLIRSLMFTLSGDLLRCLMLSVLIRHFSWDMLEFSVNILKTNQTAPFFFFPRVLA